MGWVDLSERKIGEYYDIVVKENLRSKVLTTRMINDTNIVTYK